MGTKAEIAKRRKHVKDGIAFLENYILSYSDQAHYEDYHDETIIDDMLYAVGIAVWGEAEHKGPSGYAMTKQKLRDHLD